MMPILCIGSNISNDVKYADLMVITPLQHMYITELAFIRKRDSWKEATLLT